ncbi:ATP synthase subunit I [Bacillaceae bacterium SIJ1]|uniref:ATP synthase subunit I n=1 Tax=Litoribacterium kuwaitense TaxID=1398745 RepID=UPI0013ED33AE|nr:ATP synthase subunit I [Litoribacterium kuwaitense]NGP44731.1 ATP synthase subunit I [Litoribacterium kuwaitense]
MSDLRRIYRRHMQWLFFLLAFFVIGWGFTDLTRFFLGLMFGTILGMFNHWLLAFKINKFGESVVRGQSVRSLGTASRFATAIFATLISLEFEAHIQLYAVIIGLMTPYLVIMIDALFQSMFRRIQEER